MNKGSDSADDVVDGSGGHSLRTITSTSDGTMRTDEEKLWPMFFVEMNPFAPDSVVLLHVLFCCHLEWKHVWPKLPGYHLLIPDYPCHSNSKKVCSNKDFSIGLCADLVAKMIRDHAHDGKAHIVGLSTGGFIAMDLVRRHPHVVKSALVSGAWPQKGKRLTAAKNPRILYSGLWTILHTPRSFLFKVSQFSGEYQSSEILAEIKRNCTRRLAQSGASYATEWQEEMMKEVGKADLRICMVAAGKQDFPEGVHDAAKLLRSQSTGGEGSETCAYVVRDAIHAWNLQHPALFAKGIQCWIERLPMPAKFEAMPI